MQSDSSPCTIQESDQGRSAAFLDEAHDEHRTIQAIFVLGPSSSGKTTLCNALADDMQLDPSCYIKEVARTVMKTYGFTRADTDTYEMQYAIMAAQLRAEADVLAALKKTGGGVLLSDRSAIDPIVYARTSTVPGASERQGKLLEDENLSAILPFYRDALFVVLQPVPEWVHDDGVRSLEDPWLYNLKLQATLEELNIHFTCIGQERKKLGDRVIFVKQLVDATRSRSAGE